MKLAMPFHYLMWRQHSTQLPMLTEIYTGSMQSMYTRQTHFNCTSRYSALGQISLFFKKLHLRFLKSKCNWFHWTTTHSVIIPITIIKHVHKTNSLIGSVTFIPNFSVVWKDYYFPESRTAGKMNEERQRHWKHTFICQLRTQKRLVLRSLSVTDKGCVLACLKKCKPCTAKYQWKHQRRSRHDHHVGSEDWRKVLK